MSTQVRALPARRESGASLLSRVDATAFGVLLAAVVAIPVTFSIANPDVFAMPKTILAVGLAVLLMVLLGIRWIASSARIRDLRGNPLAWMIVAFVAWNVAAYGLAIDPPHALIGERRQYQGLGTTLAYVVYLLAAWTTVRGPARRGLLLTAVAVGAAVVSTYAVVQRAELDPIWSELSEGRVFSTIGQANALAAYLVLALPLTAGLAAGRHIAVQALVAALVVLQLAALAFTLSRGGLLGAGLATLTLAAILLVRRETVSRRGLAIAGATVLSVGLLVAAVPDLRAGAERAFDRVVRPGTVEEASTSAHLDQWAVGLSIIGDHPIFGAGQESYVLLFGDYRDQVIEPERARVWEKYRPESPHNVYLAVAGGAGLPALAAYLAIIGIAGWRAMAGMRRTATARTWIVGGCMLAAIAGHLATDAFMTAETTGSVLFWTVLGSAAALRDHP